MSIINSASRVLATSAVPTVGVKTKLVRLFAGTIPYVSGQPANPLRLPQVNYLAGIDIEISGTMTCVGTSTNTLTSEGIAALVQSAQLNLSGKLVPVSSRGQGLKILNQVMDATGGIPEVAPVTSSASPGAANAWSTSLKMPVSVDLWRGDLRGVQYAGDTSISQYLQIVWGTEGQAVALGASNTATFSGAAAVYVYSIVAPRPVPATGKAPAQGLYGQASWAHMFTEKVISNVNVGNNDLNLDTGNEMARVIIAVKNNGTYTTDVVSYIQIIIQDLAYSEYWDAQSLNRRLSERYAMPFDSATGLAYLPAAAGTPEQTGIYVVDQMATHTDRDILDLRTATSAVARVTIPSGTSLVNPEIHLYQEQLVPLTQPLFS